MDDTTPDPFAPQEANQTAIRAIPAWRPTHALHEEWGLRYDAQPNDVVFGRAENPDGTVTRVTPMPSEKHARAAQASHAPIGAKNKTVVHRLVSEWEVRT